MGLTAGIIGLPNVGKSTLFNALTRSSAEATSYPYATITPNVGVVEVVDTRVDELAKIFKSKKLIYTTMEFYDIAGLAKGASTGEGLGNQFLGYIKEVDAICHVVRCFEDSNVAHIEDRLDPIADIEIVNLELILSDLQIIENRLNKVERKMKLHDKEAILEYGALNKLKEALLNSTSAKSVDLSKDELLLVKSFSLLTMKPVIYIANFNEEEIVDYSTNIHYLALEAFAQANNTQVIAISAKVEAELVKLDDDSKLEFMEMLGIVESGLDQVANITYTTLGLKTFLTAGEPEARAWTFKAGLKAPACAGVIHSDIERGFIKAEVYRYEDILIYGSELALKQNGKFRIEGKEYLVQDGDVVHFRFNV